MKYTDTECPGCGETPDSGIGCTVRVMETTAGVFPRVRVFDGPCGVCGAPEGGTHHIACLDEPCAACWWGKSSGWWCSHDTWFILHTMAEETR